MSPLLQILSLNAVLLAAAMMLLWLVSLRLRNASIVDVFWGLGFVLGISASLAWQQSASTRGIVVLILTVIWGVRLAVYVARRNHGQGEDRRYAAMRQTHGASFWWWSLVSVFLLQAAILWVIALPLQAIASHVVEPFGGVWDILGMVLWLVGFGFEVIGDWQLARFKAQPQNHGRVMDRGLWRYTRHPNYFGESCLWWGIYCFACANGDWWTIVSPLILTVFLLKFSGVGLLEATITDRRPEYAAYQQRTSAFFPWLPQRP
jgi:steroid 5-alpha reductase family enzyme